MIIMVDCQSVTSLGSCSEGVVVLTRLSSILVPTTVEYVRPLSESVGGGGGV